MKWIAVAISVILALLTLFLPLPISEQASVVLAITVVAAVLWVSEALPLHITALLAAFLLVVFGGFSPEQAFNPFFDPVVVLLFGGFVMAVAIAKHGLDKKIGHAVLSRASQTKFFLLAVMAITAFLSMWISNTASTAMMLPIALVALKAGGPGFGKALALGVAYAANIGGQGSIVGTPPNAIAVSHLAGAGITVTFFDWVVRALPFVVIAVLIAWVVLLAIFRPGTKKIKMKSVPPGWNREQKAVLAVVGLTILLWLSSGLHGVPDSAIALVPVILFYLFGLLGPGDFSKVSWGILILIGGGLSLGKAIALSGLSDFAASSLAGLLLGQPQFIALWAIILLAIVLTVFMSNTATTAIYVPVVLPMAAMLGLTPASVGMGSAMGSSLDFLVPVGTPPNAIAYSSGLVRVKDMIKAGLIIALLTSLLLAGFALLW